MEKKTSLTDLRQKRIAELEEELRELREEEETEEVVSEDELEEEAEDLLGMLSEMTKEERYEMIGKAKVRLEAATNLV